MVWLQFWKRLDLVHLAWMIKCFFQIRVNPWADFMQCRHYQPEKLRRYVLALCEMDHGSLKQLSCLLSHEICMFHCFCYGGKASYVRHVKDELIQAVVCLGAQWSCRLARAGHHRTFRSWIRTRVEPYPVKLPVRDTTSEDRSICCDVSVRCWNCAFWTDTYTNRTFAFLVE